VGVRHSWARLREERSNDGTRNNGRIDMGRILRQGGGVEE